MPVPAACSAPERLSRISATTPHLPDGEQQLERLVAESEPAQLPLDPDVVAVDELREDPLAARGVDPDRLEQRRVERRIADPDAEVLQAGGLERVAEDGEHLGGAAGRGGADQLDAGLQELARLAALRPDPAIGVGDIGEAERRLGSGRSGSR